MRARGRTPRPSSRRAFVLTPFLVLGFVLAGAHSGLAQESSIQGTITDASKAVIPGAEIMVTNVDTGVSKNALTNQEGLYLVPLLKEGRYKVACRMTGF